MHHDFCPAFVARGVDEAAFPAQHPKLKVLSSAICVSTNRLTFGVVSVSDSVHPIDRPAARSAAKHIFGGQGHPTDRPAQLAVQPSVPTRPSRSTDPGADLDGSP